MSDDRPKDVLARLGSSWDGKQTIHADVEYYDDAERAKFASYPTSKVIDEVVRAGVDIPVAEFLTYYLFYRKRPGKEGFRSYQELSHQIHRALVDLAGWVEHNGTSICAAEGTDPFDRSTVERIGESIGLSVIGRIHRLTEADWDRIPEHPGRAGFRTFDFQIASDGTHPIQVETKGTCIDINTSHGRAGTIPGHRANLDRKKQSIAEATSTLGYPYPASLRYGAITSIDRKADGVARCLLTDPPGDPIERTPFGIRLLNRLRFIRDLIRFVAQRSQLASAIATRVAALEEISDPRQLDGVPLMRGNGEPFEFVGYPGFYRRHSGFMASRSRIADGPAGGSVLLISENALFFCGFQERLLVLAAEQKFEDIVSFDFSTASIRKRVICVFSAREFKRTRLPDGVRERARTRAGRVELSLEGTIHYSAGGLVFGLLPLPLDAGVSERA